MDVPMTSITVYVAVPDYEMRVRVLYVYPRRRDTHINVPSLYDVGIRCRPVARHDSIVWEVRMIKLGVTVD